MNPNPFPPPQPPPFAPLPPPVPYSFVRAVFGPVMLLMIGILFAIDYGGGASVTLTWPALIIVAGLLKLAEFMGARNS
jgi:hypothetical protein